MQKNKVLVWNVNNLYRDGEKYRSRAWARGSGCLPDNLKKSDATARLSRLQLRGQAEARDTDQEVTGVDEITQAETK